MWHFTSLALQGLAIPRLGEEGLFQGQAVTPYDFFSVTFLIVITITAVITFDHE